MENSLRKANGNIKKLYLSSIFEMMLFAVPILIPFYVSIGLKESDIFYAQATFALAIASFEVPSGYIADYFGRKYTMILSGLIMIGGIFIYSQALSLTAVIVAEILCGISLSLRSGVNEAIMYDSLLLLQEESTYQKRDGLMGAFALVAEGFSCIAGGLLATVSLRLPFYAELTAFAVGLFITSMLHEPERKLPSKNHIENFRKAFQKLWWKDSRIFWLTMVNGIISATTFAQLWFAQIFFKKMDVDLVWFGVFFAAGSFSAALGNYISHHTQGYFSQAKQWILIITLTLIGFIGLNFPPLIAIVLALAPRLAWGILSPLSNVTLNRLVDSDLRVTMLSIRSMIQNAIFIAIGPIYGWIHNVYSFTTAIAAGSFMLLIFGGLSLWKMLRAMNAKSPPPYPSFPR